MTRTKHRQSLRFGWRALVAREGTVLPAPRTPTDRQFEPCRSHFTSLSRPQGSSCGVESTVTRGRTLRLESSAIAWAIVTSSDSSG